MNEWTGVPDTPTQRVREVSPGTVCCGGEYFGFQSVYQHYSGAFRLGRTISSLSGHSSQGAWSLLVAGQGRGQNLMVIPLMWDAGGRVKAPPLSEHIILLLQHWPRAQKHPSSFPGEEYHFLLIPVISYSLRQAPFGPKRKLGKDFNWQIALFHPERFTFLGSADPCCAPGPLGVEVYVYPRTHPLSTTLVRCTPNQEGKKLNVLQQARPCPAFPFHNESTAVFSAQHYQGRGSWQRLWVTSSFPILLVTAEP